MIAGLSHLSTAFSAMRVAEAAQARAEQAREQVATGRRVNGAKDDGAAFVIEMQARSDRAQWNGRQRVLDRMEGALNIQKNYFDQFKEDFERLRQLIVEGREFAAGSQDRQILANEYNGLVRNMKARTDVLPGINGAAYGAWAEGTGTRTMLTDSFVNGQNWAVYPPVGPLSVYWLGYTTGAATLYPVALDGFDFANANAAALDDALTTATTFSRHGSAGSQWWVNATGRELNRVETLREAAAKQETALAAATSALVDADMGAVSTLLRASEARAEMATAGIARAISIYAQKNTAVLDAALSNWSRVRAFA